MAHKSIKTREIFFFLKFKIYQRLFELDKQAIHTHIMIFNEVLIQASRCYHFMTFLSNSFILIFGKKILHIICRLAVLLFFSFVFVPKKHVVVEKGEKIEIAICKCVVPLSTTLTYSHTTEKVNCNESRHLRNLGCH